MNNITMFLLFVTQLGTVGILEVIGINLLGILTSLFYFGIILIMIQILYENDANCEGGENGNK